MPACAYGQVSVVSCLQFQVSASQDCAYELMPVAVSSCYVHQTAHQHCRMKSDCLTWHHGRYKPKDQQGLRASCCSRLAVALAHYCSMHFPAGCCCTTLQGPYQRQALKWGCEDRVMCLVTAQQTCPTHACCDTAAFAPLLLLWPASLTMLAGTAFPSF